MINVGPDDVDLHVRRGFVEIDLAIYFFVVLIRHQIIKQ